MKLTKQAIDDIMVTVLEGGINYWCIAAIPETIKEREEGEYLSDIISKGKNIVLIDDEKKEHILTFSNFKRGFEIFQKRHHVNDVGDIDADFADQIIQYAIFGKLIYG